MIPLEKLTVKSREALEEALHLATKGHLMFRRSTSYRLTLFYN